MVPWGSVHDFVLLSKPSEDVEGLHIKPMDVTNLGGKAGGGGMTLRLKTTLLTSWNDRCKSDKF